MKFSTSFSSLVVVVLPLLLQAAALPSGFGGNFGGNFGGAGRGNQGGRFGGNNQNQNQKGANGNNNANNANNANTANNATNTANNNNNNNNANNANNNNANNANNNGNAQTSFTLDPAVIGSNIAQNGLTGNGSETGEVASLTSTNNFINFCLTTNQPITNGIQITSGSCNPIPMGQIPASNKIPSCKFSNPTNGQVIGVNQTFTITMNIQNLATGNFANAETNFMGAPQQLDGSGQILGHSHVVIQPINGLTDTQPGSATNFVFFKGLNSAAVGGVLSATVSGGLDAGTYKLCSINTAANHQPALAPIAQHAPIDDCVYFTVSNSGGGQDVFGNGGAAASGGANNAAAGGANGAATGGANNAAAGGANNAAAGGAKGAAAGGANNANAKGANGAATGGANNANAKGANAAGAKGANNANGQKAGGAAKQQQGKGRRSFAISRH